MMNTPYQQMTHLVNRNHLYGHTICEFDTPHTDVIERG